MQVDISKTWSVSPKTKLTAIELFCGCGGMSKGLINAGIDMLLGVDFFQEAGETYKSNFKHLFLLGDVTDENTKQKIVDLTLSKLNGRELNIIAGGFPCQGFSMAGKRDINDNRNKLYLELLDIVKRLKPEFILMENVKGILSMNGGLVVKQIVNDFKKIGYTLDYKLFNAVHFEVPQKRERVIFIGNRIGKKNVFPQNIVENNFKTIKDAIEDLMEVSDNKDINHISTKHKQDMQDRLSQVEEGKSLYSNYSDSWKKSPWNEPSCTIKENHGAVNIHPRLPRVLTVRECARIQGFPDDFIFKGPKNKQLVQIGNAVPPNLSKAVALSIIQSYNN